MAKFVAIAAVCLAAILAVAVVGQGDTEQQQRRAEDVQCQRELQESPLDACRQVLHLQLTSSSTGYGGPAAPFRWITGLRMQCCQQLLDVSRECRCAAIRRMVRGYEQTMPPLEEGGGGGGYYYGGESSTGHGGYFGAGAQCSQQQQGGYSGCGEMGWPRWQQGGGGYCGRAGHQGGQGCGYGCGQRREEYGTRGQQRTTRVRLSKVRLHAARLPMMCEIEPQDCSVFSGAGSEYYQQQG